MKIAIISDTHGNVANFKKAVDWLNKENIQLILHCGDIGNPESLKESLEDFKGEFFGVFGNMDKDFKILAAEYNKIPRVKINEEIFELETESSGQIRPLTNSSELVSGKRIAITHFPDVAKKLAQSTEFDLIFYGHTHRPWEEKVGECRIINPGELAGQFQKPCFAVYDTETDSLELKILEKL